MSSLLSPFPLLLLLHVASASPVKAAKVVTKVPGSLLGMGLGFGLMEKNGERADGVGIYIKKAANLVLSQVVGEKVFGSGGQNSWEERYRQKQVIKRQQKGKVAASHESPAGSLQSPTESASAHRASANITRPQTVHAAFRYSTGSESGSHGISNSNQANSTGHSQGRHSLGGLKGKATPTPSKAAVISTPVAAESPEPTLHGSLQTVTEGFAESDLPAVVASPSPIQVVSMVLGSPGGEKKSPCLNVFPKLSPRGAAVKNVTSARPLTAQPLSKAVAVVHTASNRVPVGGKLQPPTIVMSPTSTGKPSPTVGGATHTVRLLKSIRQDKDKSKGTTASAPNPNHLFSKSMNGPVNSLPQRATSSSSSQGSKKPGRMSLPSGKAPPVAEHVHMEKAAEISLQLSPVQAAVVSDSISSGQLGVLVGQVD